MEILGKEGEHINTTEEIPKIALPVHF